VVVISIFRSHFTYLQISFIIAKNRHNLLHLSRGCVALFLLTFLAIMAGYLRGYDYEPEYWVPQKNLTNFRGRPLQPARYTSKHVSRFVNAMVLHNRRWWTSFLSLNIVFIWNLLSLSLMPLKFI